MKNFKEKVKYAYQENGHIQKTKLFHASRKQRIKENMFLKMTNPKKDTANN
jgi:hypothetical protein